MQHGARSAAKGLQLIDNFSQFILVGSSMQAGSYRTQRLEEVSDNRCLTCIAGPTALTTGS